MSKMKICYFKIKPSDTLLFRDGHVFRKELNNYVESLNMPYPSVFYGAIFSALLRQGKFQYILNFIKEKSLNFDEELKENFRINSIYIYDEIDGKLYIKAPLDLFESDNEIRFGTYKNNLLYSPKSLNSKFDRVDDKFIRLDQLINCYSNGEIKDIKLYSSDHFFIKYKKVGIEISLESKTAKDENLYRIDMVEFRDKRFSYILECEISNSVEEFKNDVIKLGGEGKLASFTHTFKSLNIIKILYDFYASEEFIQSDKKKVILTSPMIIENFEEFVKENDIEYAVTGKPQYIGGFDMANNRQKPIRKAIPAGSILVVRCKQDKFFIPSFIQSSESRFKGFASNIIVPFNEEEGY